MCVYIYRHLSVYTHIVVCIHTYLNLFVLMSNPVSPNSVWCVFVTWLKMCSCHRDLCDSEPTTRNSEVTSPVLFASLVL